MKTHIIKKKRTRTTLCPKYQRQKGNTTRTTTNNIKTSISAKEPRQKDNHRENNTNNLLAFMNKKKAEAIAINHTPQNNKSKAKANTVNPLQGTGDIGNLFGIQIPQKSR
eukprot:2348061-Heterocapsa_arctica.AAC.1